MARAKGRRRSWPTCGERNSKGERRAWIRKRRAVNVRNPPTHAPPLPRAGLILAACTHANGSTGERRSRVMSVSDVLKLASEKAASMARYCLDSCAASSSRSRANVREM